MRARFRSSRIGGAPGLRVVEVSIEFRDRALGETKLGWRTGFEFLTQCTAIAWKRMLGARRLALPSRASTAGLSGIGKESS